MSATPFDLAGLDVAWCPGCGNFAILQIVKQAVAELGLSPRDLVVVSGIGQAAKTPQYFRTNMFNGLHGRALPVATGVKAANPALIVIAEGGDGDMYGEGGNHFLATIRRNPDITHLVHNNMVYGLTKGQASPTSERGFTTPVQVAGVINEPFNPVAVALALDASFIARAFSSDIPKAVAIVKAAIRHKGYSLVDIFQPCVTFNKTNNYKWYQDHTYYLDDAWDPTNRPAAFAKAIEKDRYCLGVIYTAAPKPVFEEAVPGNLNDKTPLPFRQPADPRKLESLMHVRGDF